MLSAITAPWDKKGEDPGACSASAPSPASPSSSVEGDHSLHRPKCHWINTVSVNIAGVITDLADYVSSPGPNSMQVDPFMRQIY